jgi:hypothetical protein
MYDIDFDLDQFHIAGMFTQGYYSANKINKLTYQHINLNRSAYAVCVTKGV